MIVTAVESTQYIPIEVYVAYLSDFTVSQAMNLRRYLTDGNFEIACTENKKPKFPDTPEHRTVLGYFKNQRWISSYKIHDGFIRVYPTHK